MTISSGRITGSFNVTGTKAHGIGTAQFNGSQTLDILFANGVVGTANQANTLYSAQQTALAAAGVVTMDLDAGTLTDAFGTALVFTSVKALYIKNTSTTVSITLHGLNGSVPGTAQRITIPPGGLYLVCNPSAAGWGITAATTDTIVITNLSGAATASYDLLLLGTV